jgi:hypothetical protein
VNIQGTWANNGYEIIIPSGNTAIFNNSGTITTGSPAGTLSVNGTVYWYGNNIGVATSDAQATFPLTFSGTGIFIGSPAGQGTATTSLSMTTETNITVNNHGPSGTGSGYIPYYNFTNLQGGVVGTYTLGIHDSTASTYAGFVLIYIGTASNVYTINKYFGYNTADKSGDTIYVFNMLGSAGTIGIEGTAYV